MFVGCRGLHEKKKRPRLTARSQGTDGWTDEQTLVTPADGDNNRLFPPRLKVHHYIKKLLGRTLILDWKMRGFVLQTHLLYEHLAEELVHAVTEWTLERADIQIPVTTDNAQRIVQLFLQCNIAFASLSSFI